MARRRRAEKREVVPDAKYGDVVVAKLMNTVMSRGKKSVAEQIVYGSFEMIEKAKKKNPSRTRGRPKPRRRS